MSSYETKQENIRNVLQKVQHWMIFFRRHLPPYEAAKRVLGMEHYRVQIIGGIILHQGRIAEMKTGEGKTLVSTLPAYLNALEEKVSTS